MKNLYKRTINNNAINPINLINPINYALHTFLHFDYSKNEGKQGKQGKHLCKFSSAIYILYLPISKKGGILDGFLSKTQKN